MPHSVSAMYFYLSHSIINAAQLHPHQFCWIVLQKMPRSSSILLALYRMQQRDWKRNVNIPFAQQKHRMVGYFRKTKVEARRMAYQMGMSAALLVCVPCCFWWAASHSVCVLWSHTAPGEKQEPWRPKHAIKCLSVYCASGLLLGTFACR